jgi:hypothetical protein
MSKPSHRRLRGRLCIFQCVPAQKDFPANAHAARTGLMPPLDLIIGGGGAISDGTSLGQSLLLLLDGIQPVGILPVCLTKIIYCRC